MSLVIEPMPHDVDGALRIWDRDLPKSATAYAYRTREGVPEIEVAHVGSTYTADELRVVITILQAAVSEAEAAAR